MKSRFPEIIITVVLIALVVLINYLPEEKVWTDDFTRGKRMPYSSKYVYDNIKAIFPKSKVEIIERTAYEELSNYEGYSYDYFEPEEDILIDSSANAVLDSTSSDGFNSDVEYSNNPAILDQKIDKEFSNYIFINTKLSFDESDCPKLFEFVKKGNIAFMAAIQFEGAIADEFNIRTNNSYFGDTAFQVEVQESDKRIIPFTLTNKSFKLPRQYQMRGVVYGNGFTSLDSSRAEILGYNGKGEVNFVRFRYGKGYFYLSSVPHCYSNYAMSDFSSSEYTSTTLSYLPLNKIMWDEYYKVGKVVGERKLNYFSVNKSLRWTWNLALIGCLIYLLFESKRNQRFIPILKKVRNTSMDFVYTIGRLYLQKGDHKDLAMKKIQYFLEYIRHQFYLPTHEINDQFLMRLSQKSGVERKDLEKLFSQIAQVQRSSAISRDNLINLCSNIDSFKNNSKLR